MGKIEQLISALEDFNSRFQARKELALLPADEVCPLLMNYLARDDAQENGIWAALQIMKKHSYKATLEILPQLMQNYPSLTWDIRAAQEDISGELSEISPDDSINPFADLRALLGIDLIAFSDKGAFFSFVLKTDLTRKHEMILMEEGDHYHIYTECGPAEDEVVEQLDSLNKSLDLGELKIEDKEGGVRALSLHYAIKRESSPAEQKTVLTRLAQVADGLEKQLSDEDLI